MKIHEILNEAPASMLGQIGRRVGAAALGAVGARGFAADLSGSADQKELANRYYYEFRKWAGGTGTALNNVRSGDLRDFFKEKGIPSDHVPDTDMVLDPKSIENIFSQSASDKIRGRGTGKFGKNDADTDAAGTTNVAGSGVGGAATAAQIRQQRQGAAAAQAQQQMAANPAPAAAVSQSTDNLEKDKIYVGSDGKSYRWLGAQWQSMETGRSVSAKAPELSDPQPETPEQKRIRLQAAATKQINKTAKAVRRAPKVKTPPVAV
jgi:hypothetical protein